MSNVNTAAPNLTVAAAPAALELPARSIPVPVSISPEAREHLQRAVNVPDIIYPALTDADGWRQHVAPMDAQILPYLKLLIPAGDERVDEQFVAGVRCFLVTPTQLEGDPRVLMLDMHGGGLILCGGELGLQMAIWSARRYRCRVLTIDFRMAPDHPYPAALEDGLAVYRQLLQRHALHSLVFHGASGGGNLIAALVLRGRDEGLPLPAGLILNTPQLDLTESGDSFQTNRGLDTVLASLMPVNRLYANGHDLAHSYLSPLFGDFTRGFPPTLLITGTRDLFLSKTVRMHHALRAADVDADLHVIEAGPHGNFPNGAEYEEINRQGRLFIRRVTQPRTT
jgi:acetyl esterase/lipase